MLKEGKKKDSDFGRFHQLIRGIDW